MYPIFGKKLKVNEKTLVKMISGEIFFAYEASGLETAIICRYCNRKYEFDIRYGEEDKIWRRLRPTKRWTAPIFGKGEYVPTTVEKCECGAMFIFSMNEKEAIAGLSRRRGRKRGMSVEKTGVEVGGF